MKLSKPSKPSKPSNKKACLVIDEYCDRIIIGILFLMILTIALIFDARITSFDLAKVTAMRVLTLIIIGIWLLKLTFTKKAQFIRTPLDIPILAYLIINIATTITGVHPYMSLVGEYKRYDGLLSTFNYIILYYIAVNFLRERKYLKRTIIFITIAGVLSALVGILQSYGIDLTKWESGVISTFGNPNFIGGYLAIVFFAPLTLFFLYPEKLKEKKNQVRKVILLGLCLVSLLLIYKCFSILSHRGGALGLGAGIILFGFLLHRQLLKAKLRLAVLFVVMGVASAVFFLGGQSGLVQKFASTVKMEKEEGKAIPTLKFTSTAKTRVYIWQTGLEIIKRHPFLGIGPDALRFVSTQYEKLEFIRTEGGRNCLIDKAHNEFIDIATTRGLLGLGAYLWIIILLFYQVFPLINPLIKRIIILLFYPFYPIFLLIKFIERGVQLLKPGFKFLYQAFPSIKEENKILLVGVLAAIVSYLVQNQVGFGIIATSSLFWLLLGMAIPIGMPKPHNTKPISLPIIPRIAIGIPLMVLIYYGVSLSLRPYIADIYYKNGMAMNSQGNTDQAIASYEKALEYNPGEEFYYGEVLNAYNIKSNQTQDMAWLDKLIAKGEEAVKCNPLHPYYYNLLSSSYGEKYVRTGDNAWANKSIEASKKALIYKPLFADPYNNIAAIYVRQERYEEAIKEMEQASALFPDDPNYLRILGELYQVTGKIDKSIELLKKAIVYNSKNADLYGKLGKIYFDQKKYKEAETQFKKAIELDAKNIFARNNLGTIYINQQKLKQARQEFEAVLNVEPQNSYARQMMAMIGGI
ncbi:MAG: tetratricopeptide repeat protein [Nitrospirota bacterium]